METLKYNKGKLECYEKVISKTGKSYNKAIYFGTGYYFKGEFLARTKYRALEILRKRIEDKGREMARDFFERQNPFLTGKKYMPEETNVIFEHHEKQKAITEKIEKSKKWYYDKLKYISLEDKLEKLKKEIRETKEKQEKIIKKGRWKKDRLHFKAESIEKVKKELDNVVLTRDDLGINEDSIKFKDMLNGKFHYNFYNNRLKGGTN